MAEQFGLAALRHLATAETLETNGHVDDAAYHYGLAGETAVKQSLLNMGIPIQRNLQKHFDNDLHKAINDIATLNVLASGRLASDVQSGVFVNRFSGWSILIRYADTTCCPVTQQKLADWKNDAVHLTNGGAF